MRGRHHGHGKKPRLGEEQVSPTSATKKLCELEEDGKGKISLSDLAVVSFSFQMSVFLFPLPGILFLSTRTEESGLRIGGMGGF